MCGCKSRCLYCVNTSLDTIYEIVLLLLCIERDGDTAKSVRLSQYNAPLIAGRTSISGVCGDLLHYLPFVAAATIVLGSLAIVNDVASRLSAVGAILCESACVHGSTPARR